MRTTLQHLGFVFAFLLLTVGLVRAQELRGRVSLQMKGSSIQRSVAPGLYLDAKVPIAGGFSITGGGSFSAFLLEGRDEARYSFDPALTLRVALPSRSLGATTIFGGGGYHLPFAPNSKSSSNAGNTAGPTLHLGVGRIWALRESTLFLDLVPTVVVQKKSIAVLLPLRAGVVF